MVKNLIKTAHFTYSISIHIVKNTNIISNQIFVSAPFYQFLTAIIYFNPIKPSDPLNYPSSTSSPNYSWPCFFFVCNYCSDYCCYPPVTISLITLEKIIENFFFFALLFENNRQVKKKKVEKIAINNKSHLSAQQISLPMCCLLKNDNRSN